MSVSRERFVAAGGGDEPVDLVVRNANLVNVFTAETYPADIGIKGDRFAAIAPYDDEDGRPSFELEGLREVSANRLYAMPGFFDAHVHIESTMVRPDEFARAVLRNGTTAVVIDPHEIANVLGAEGVRYMIEAARGLPVRILTTVPSCVPAVPGLEYAGAEFRAEEIDELLGLPGGVAELMDYPGVINRHPRMASIVRVGLDRQVVKASSQYPSGFSPPTPATRAGLIVGKFRARVVSSLTWRCCMERSITLAENDEETRECLRALFALWPRLADLPEDELMAKIDRQRRGGYRLARLKEGGEVKAVAGFRTSEHLHWGRYLYVDDRATLPEEVGEGYGGALLDWLIESARAQGCDQFHLDTAYGNNEAILLYLGRGMTMLGHHFCLRL